MKSDNPYIAARLEWNYLFSDLMKAKTNWQWVALLSLIANLLLIAGFIWVSLQSKYIPYAIKVDQLGNVLFSDFLTHEKTITPLEVNAFLRQYLINARSILLDSFAQKRAIDFVYSVSLPAVRKCLDNHYQEQDPFKIAKQELVEVQVTAVIQKSASTWQVDWVEVHRSLNGQVLNQSHYEALVTICHQCIKNPELLNTNPLGIFIRQLNWAQQN